PPMLRQKLSSRLFLEEIHALNKSIAGSPSQKQELFNLLFDQDDQIAYQAAWAMSHFNPIENEWLYSKQDELIDFALVCKHPGKLRLALTILYRQPLETERVD